MGDTDRRRCEASSDEAVLVAVIAQFVRNTHTTSVSRSEFGGGSTRLFVLGAGWACPITAASAVTIAQPFAALSFAARLPASILGRRRKRLRLRIVLAASALMIRMMRLTRCARHIEIRCAMSP
jgi:hypothetical protein